MPVYEIHCQSCGKSFDVSEPVAAHEQRMKQRTLACPNCGSTQVEAQLGIIDVRTSRKS